MPSAADLGAPAADPGASTVTGEMGVAIRRCFGECVLEGELLRRWKRFATLPTGHLSLLATLYAHFDLLPYSNHLATTMLELGCLHAYEFDVTVLHDNLPPHAPIRYPPEQRAWLCAYLQDLEQAGIVERVVNCPYASQVVLVPQGRTDLDFRVC